MGIVTIDKTDHLLWLGRYTERVHTILKGYFNGYDRMIDSNDNEYKNICNNLEIEDIYGSKEEFIKRYPFDQTDPNSIISNLNRAYDNAVVMRDQIGTLTLSYIQLAVYDMKNAETSDSPLIELQHVIDNILAFWGCVDDAMDDEEERSIVKSGKRIERLSLFLSLRADRQSIRRELMKLRRRIARTGMRYNRYVLDDLEVMFDKENLDYAMAIKKLQTLLDV